MYTRVELREFRIRFSLMKYLLAHSADIMTQQSNPYNGQNNQIVFLI